MKPPVRLRDDPAAPHALRDLLRDAPRSRPLTRDVRGRSAARVDRLLVVPAAAGGVFWIKAVALAGVLGAAGAVVVTRAVPRHDAHEAAASVPTTVAPSPRPRPHAPVPPVAVPSVDPSPAPTPPVASAVPARPVPVPVSHAAAQAPLRAAVRREGVSVETAPAEFPRAPEPSPRGNLLDREAALLESARAELSADPARALARLGEHASEFPEGVLATEREVLTIDALRRLGRAAEARNRARALLARSHGSPYERRIQGILDATPAP